MFNRKNEYAVLRSHLDGETLFSRVKNIDVMFGKKASNTSKYYIEIGLFSRICCIGANWTFDIVLMLRISKKLYVIAC